MVQIEIAAAPAPPEVVAETMQAMGCVRLEVDWCGVEGHRYADWGDRGCPYAAKVADRLWTKSVTYFLERQHTPTIKVEDATGVIPIAVAQALKEAAEEEVQVVDVVTLEGTEQAPVIWPERLRQRAEKVLHGSRADEASKEGP